MEEELEHIEAYIRIQKLRYGEEAFSFEATTDGDIGEWKVPSLLLQTLVENSVVHGVSLDRKSEISLYLTNETYEDGEYLYICISDTGNGFSKEALDAIENDTPIIYHGRHHVGISNIKRRLALMYGERASITCSNMDENYGAVVEVRLPKTDSSDKKKGGNPEKHRGFPPFCVKKLQELPEPDGSGKLLQRGR